MSKREREVFFVKSEVMMNRPLIGDLLPVLKNILLQISSQNAHKEWSCTFELSCNKKNGRREVGLLRGGRRPVASCSQGGRWAGRGQAAPRPQVKQPGATFLQLVHVLCSLQPDGSLAYTLQPKVESPTSRPKVSILRQPHKPKVFSFL